MSNLILCFSEIPKIFMFPRKAGGFFIWGLNKSCPSEEASSLRFSLYQYISTAL